MAEKRIGRDGNMEVFFILFHDVLTESAKGFFFSFHNYDGRSACSAGTVGLYADGKEYA